MLLKCFLIACFILVSFSTKTFACHEGGAMGFASGNINGLLIDLTSIPTFIFASTSGTSGCKNWEFATATEQELYVAFNWHLLARESAQGYGKSIDALATLSQCPKQAYTYFQKTMHHHYHALFDGKINSQKDAQTFLNQVQSLINDHSQLSTLCL